MVKRFWGSASLQRVGSSGGKVILTTSAANADSGWQCPEAKFWTNWTFTLVGTFTGYAVYIYGTLDGVNWFLLAAPSEQSGTGAVVNPMTQAGQQMQYSKPLIGCRAVAVGTGQTGTVSVEVAVVP